MKSIAYPLSGTRILIVEDEYYLADDLSRALTEAGAEIVGPAGSVAEALQKVEERGFDCAVLDMNLRGDFAYAIADQLRQAAIPFVIATGYNRASLPDTLKDAPSIEKPFTTARLIGLVSTLSERDRTGA